MIYLFQNSCPSHLLVSATALQSLEIASDTILSGKAKVMIAGGFDDISEEGSYEFANMKATSNAETEFAMGREPTEMSRPATTSRAGVSYIPTYQSIWLTESSVYGVSSMYSYFTDKFHLISFIGHRCPHRHERQDSLGVGSANSWYFSVYFNIYVRLLQV